MTTDHKILIDNATLSGVERLLGYSQILNLNNIDNDILCFEKIVTAILFSDKIICVDDYKEKYRSERTRKFEFVDFLKMNSDDYTKTAAEAGAFAKSMMFSFDGSKPVGDVVSFFEALRIDPQLRWDVFVSSEYLTMSFLVNDTRDAHHETAVDSILRSEGANANAIQNDFEPSISIKGRPDITDIKSMIQGFASGNSNYSGPGHRSVLDRCVFGYGWAAERSHFYNAIAARLDADAFLAPLRDAFCESCCRIESKSQVNSLLENLKYKSQETLSKIVETSGRARFAVKLPFFTAYLISQTERPEQCLNLALHLRNQAEFRDCRTIFHNLSHLTNKERYAEVNHILRLLEQSCASLLRKYAVSTPNGPQISFSLGLAGLSASTSLKLDNLFSAYRNRPLSRLFRNISQEMLNVERLGGLHEKLCASLNIHREATHPRISLTPKFMENKESATGRPAEI